MPLESATYIDGLVSTNPAAGDGSGQGDDHLRLIKAVLKATFPNLTGAVTPTQTVLNGLDGRVTTVESTNTAQNTRLDTIEAAYVKKDGSVAMTGALNMGSQRITSVAAPSASTDAARKSEVDAKLTDVLTTRGDIIRGGVGGAEERLGLGTSGQVLSSNGTDVVWSSLTTGKVLQVVSTQTGEVATGTTTIPNDDTIPQNTEGTEFMTRSITPSSASSLLLIEVVFNFALSGGNPGAVALFQDTTADALAAVQDTVPTTNVPNCVKFSHYMVAGTTSATTFKVRGGPSTGGTMTFNGTAGARKFGGVMPSSIRITEIAA